MGKKQTKKTASRKAKFGRAKKFQSDGAVAESIVEDIANLCANLSCLSENQAECMMAELEAIELYAINNAGPARTDREWSLNESDLIQAIRLFLGNHHDLEVRQFEEIVAEHQRLDAL